MHNMHRYLNKYPKLRQDASRAKKHALNARRSIVGRIGLTHHRPEFNTAPSSSLPLAGKLFTQVSGQSVSKAGNKGERKFHFPDPYIASTLCASREDSPP
jgi:hypothetical protein